MKTIADVAKHLEALELKHPSAKESTHIPVTEEAQALLSPYYSALLASHKEFRFYGRAYTHEDVMHKCIADAMALTDEGGLCGCKEGVIDARVARLAIEELKELGI